MEKSKLYITVLLLFSLSFNACSQEKKEEHETKAVKKVEDILNNKTENKERVIFSVADREFLVVVKDADSYVEYFLAKEEGSSEIKLEYTEIKKSSNIFNKMFNKSNYKKEFITFDSDFFKPNGYELSSGNITYFVFKNKIGEKYGEARLSVFIKPNPIDQEVYLYLVNQVLYYNNNS